jgi:hypothetical protein
MKTQWLKNIGILAMLIILGNACSPIYNFQIYTLKPAAIAVQTDIQKVIIINHSYIPGYISLKDFQGNYQRDFDRDLSKQYIDALTEFLGNSPRFQVMTIYEASNSLNTKKLGLNLNIADSLCKKDGADAAIILDGYVVSKMLHEQKQYIPCEHSHQMPPSSSYEQYPNDTVKKEIPLVSDTVCVDYVKYALSLKNTSYWKIYSVKSHCVINEQIINDSTVMQTRGYDAGTAFAYLPTIWDMMFRSASRAGNEYGHRIAQEWIQETRYLFRLQGDAISYARQDEWDKAIDSWKGYTESNDLKTASMAAFNIAVAYEMKDDFINALEWAAKSYTLQKSPETDKYIEQLEERVKDKKQLIKQISFKKKGVEI